MKSNNIHYSDMRRPTTTECPPQVQSLLASLNIPFDAIALRSLELHPEASNLVVAETDELGKEHLLIPAAANAWRAMKAAAITEDVIIRIGSAFRSVDRQAEIVRSKLQKGFSLEDILAISAPPGYSEHHSGRAVDVTADGSRPFDREFEQTSAFEWLSHNVGQFGFYLSYLPNNRFGYAYEPWHWCHQNNR